jgi:hypothetical protein
MKDLRRPVFALQHVGELASGGPAGGRFVAPEAFGRT